MKKTIGITLAIMIVTNLLAGCRERMKEDKAENVQTSEIETDQEDGLMPGNGLDSERTVLSSFNVRKNKRNILRTITILIV